MQSSPSDYLGPVVALQQQQQHLLLQQQQQQQMLSNYCDDASLNLLAIPLRSSGYSSRHYPSLSMPPHVHNRVSKTTSPRRGVNRRSTFNHDDVHRRASLMELSLQQQQQRQQQQLRNIQLQQLQQQQQQLQLQQQLLEYEYWNLPRQQLSNTMSRRRQLGLMSNRPSSWHCASIDHPYPPMSNPQPLLTPNSTISYPSSHTSYLPFTPDPISPTFASSPTNSVQFQDFKQQLQQPNYICSDPIMATTTCPSDADFMMEKSWNMDEMSSNSYFGLQSPINEELLNCFQSVWNNPNSTATDSNLVTTPSTPNDIVHTEPTNCCDVVDTLQPKQTLPLEQSVEEELIGLGLYDDPETPKSPPLQFAPISSLSLDQYHQSLLEKMMGINTQIIPSCELQGKGLKLEDTFTPILSDDDDDEDDNDEDDDDNDDGDDKEKRVKNEDTQDNDENTTF